MSSISSSVYETKNGQFVFFPFSPLKYPGWVLRRDRAVENATKAESFGRSIGNPTIVMLLFFVVFYLRLDVNFYSGVVFVFVLICIKILLQFFISGGTGQYNKRIHGELISR